MYNEHNGKFYNPLFSFHLVLVCNALREHHKNYFENKLLKFFSKVHFFLKLFSTNCFLLLLLAVERGCATDFQVNQARTDLFKIYFSSLSRSRRSNIDRKKIVVCDNKQFPSDHFRRNELRSRDLVPNTTCLAGIAPTGCSFHD